MLASNSVFSPDILGNILLVGMEGKSTLTLAWIYLFVKPKAVETLDLRIQLVSKNADGLAHCSSCTRAYSMEVLIDVSIVGGALGDFNLAHDFRRLRTQLACV